MANTVEAVAAFGSFWPYSPCLDIVLCCRFAVDARPHRVGFAQSFSKISSVRLPRYVTVRPVSATAASKRHASMGHGMCVAALRFWTAVACIIALAPARVSAEEGFDTEHIFGFMIGSD